MRGKTSRKLVKLMRKVWNGVVIVQHLKDQNEGGDEGQQSNQEASGHKKGLRGKVDVGGDNPSCTCYVLCFTLVENEE